MKNILLRIAIAAGLIAVSLITVYYLVPGAVLAAAKQAARWSAGVTSKEVVVDDHTWPYLEGGSGETVLLVHGFGMDRDFWGELLPALTKKYRVIAPDLPGFGDSTKIPGAGYGIPAQAKRLNAFTEMLGLEQFHLVGFSMGGGIAGYYAGEHPERVKSLVLISALGADTPVESETEKLVKQGKKPLIFRDGEGFDVMVSMAYLHPPKIPGPIRKYLAAIGAENYGLHERIFDDLSMEGVGVLKTWLPKISAKTLILWGAKDAIVDVSCAGEFKKGIRDSRAVIIPEAGHMVYLEKPAESITAVMDFLGGN